MFNTDVAIKRGKQEIIEDIQNGIVPSNVQSFAELHDYVDAHQYGGVGEFYPTQHIVGSGDLWAADVQVVQDALDAWIKAGRP